MLQDPLWVEVFLWKRGNLVPECHAGLSVSTVRPLLPSLFSYTDYKIQNKAFPFTSVAVINRLTNWWLVGKQGM